MRTKVLTKTAMMLLCLPMAFLACDAGGPDASDETTTPEAELAAAPIEMPVADDDRFEAGGRGRAVGRSVGASEAQEPGADDSSEPGGAPNTPPATSPPGPPSSPGVVPSGAMPFRGVNLAGAEFGTAIPGTDGVDYKFPTRAEVDYFVAKGMNTFRVGFMWERLQRTAYGALTASYVAQLDAIVAYATSKGAFVILNPHNFARYYGVPVGSAAVPSAVFADVWKRLATRYASNPRVMFNLVNEPRDMPTENWVSAANAAIAGIRQVGATQTIIVPGNGWTGAHSWTSNWYGTSNAVAMLNITDPGNNVLYEVHQYLDANSGGASETCTSTSAGVDRMRGFIDWLRKNGKKGFLGEFAGGNNATCNAAVTNMMNYLMQSSDVLVGWLWWAAGPFWGEYKYTIEPKNGVDRPQMALLTPFLER